MLSMLERYKYYKQGIVTKDTNITMQKLFQTDISESQLLIMDTLIRKWEHKVSTKSVWLFAIGLITGYLLSLFIIYMRVTSGLPIFD